MNPVMTAPAAMDRARARRIVRVAGFASLLANLASTCLAQGVAGAPADSARTRVVMYGTGTPIITAEHSGNSVGVLVHGALYLFDAGPGVERRMLEGVAKGIHFDTIPAVFITHLHSDHTLGLPALLYDHGPDAAFGSGGPLTVIGPPGTHDMMGHILAAWAPDRDVRARNRDEPSPSWTARTTDIASPGIVYRDANVVVKAFEVPHSIWPHAFGYRVETADRAIVISGDTRASDAVVTACAGCDVLVHEVYAAEGFKRIPAQRQSYHAAAHTSTYELGDLATRARPALLVLYHQLYFGGATDDILLREVRSRYKGTVVSARDLQLF